MWGVNSRCVLAESDTAGGRYKPVATVTDPFCHGPSLALDPISGTWIFGHMGSGKGPRSKTAPPGCRLCKDGTTGSGNSTLYPCPKGGKGTADTVMALTAEQPNGPWTRAENLENGANSEPFFLPNGTLFFSGAGGHQCIDPKTNKSTGLCPAGCTQNAFVSIYRYETLAHALAGRANGTAWGPTRTVLAGTNNSVLCVNWEDETLWVDKRGHFHVLAHAFRGQDEDWPQPGCRKTQNVSWNEPPFWHMMFPGPCTSNGGHAYSVDGRLWHISPVAPYTAQTTFEDGSTVTWRARERPHVVFAGGEPAYLLNGVGDPIRANCTDAPSTPGRLLTEPTACQCPGSATKPNPFYPCPPQTGGENTGGPGGDHSFTLLQPIATTESLRSVKTVDATAAFPTGPQRWGVNVHFNWAGFQGMAA